MKNIYIDYGNVKSIKKAEIEKTKLENKGYKLADTKQIGLNNFVLVYAEV